MIKATLPSLLRCHLSCTWVSSKEVSITCIFISVSGVSSHLLITKMFLRHKLHMLCSKKVSPLRESCRNLSSFSLPHPLGSIFISLPWTWGWRQWPAPPMKKHTLWLLYCMEMVAIGLLGLVHSSWNHQPTSKMGKVHECPVVFTYCAWGTASAQ